MFINSEALLKRIAQVADEISAKSDGRIVFEEYIVLPYYGNIILRFDMTDADCSLQELDHYESMMYKCVRDEFLIDFMGGVYRKVGVDFQRLDQSLEACFEKFTGEEISRSIYADKICEDTRYLLRACGLNQTLDVWEIQMEKEIGLLVFEDEMAQSGSFKTDKLTVNVFPVKRKQCEGLIKALFYARRNDVSIARILLEA